MVPIFVAHVKIPAHVAEEVPVTESARVDYPSDRSRPVPALEAHFRPRAQVERPAAPGDVPMSAIRCVRITRRAQGVASQGYEVAPVGVQRLRRADDHGVRRGARGLRGVPRKTPGERGAAMIAGIAGDSSIIVAGAATMGPGFVRVAARSGHDAQRHDPRAGAAEEGRSRLGATLETLAARTGSQPMKSRPPGRFRT